MKKQLKNKLEKMEKEQLVEIIDSLCSSKETERMLKMMIDPTKSETDRMIQKFSRSVESFVCSSFSVRDFNRMDDSIDAIYTLLKYADSRLSAYIIYEVYQAAMENDLFNHDYDDFLFGLEDDLRYILEHNAELFSDKERMRYQSVFEE